MEDTKVSKYFPPSRGAHTPREGRGKKPVITIQGVKATGRIKSGAAGTQKKVTYPSCGRWEGFLEKVTFKLGLEG